MSGEAQQESMHIDPEKTLDNPLSHANHIIEHEPAINDLDQRFLEYTHSKSDLGKHILKKLDAFTPQTHPNPIDLYAGNGIVAAILVQKGWGAHNITCIDRCRPTRNLVPGATWIQWNLDMLSLSVKSNYELPTTVLAHKHTYDIVTAMQTAARAGPLSVISDFFLKPNGVVFLDIYNTPPEEYIVTGKWTEIGTFLF